MATQAPEGTPASSLLKSFMLAAGAIFSLPHCIGRRFAKREFSPLEERLSPPKLQIRRDFDRFRQNILLNHHATCRRPMQVEKALKAEFWVLVGAWRACEVSVARRRED
jgi:hypothetical protein